jgi:hypothetical protein
MWEPRRLTTLRAMACYTRTDRHLSTLLQFYVGLFRSPKKCATTYDSIFLPAEGSGDHDGDPSMHPTNLHKALQ